MANEIDFTAAGPDLTIAILTLAIEIAAIHQHGKNLPIGDIVSIFASSTQLENKLDELLDKILEAKKVTDARRN